jgi:hypothetical protein
MERERNIARLEGDREKTIDEREMEERIDREKERKVRAV